MGHENFLEILRGYKDFHQTLEGDEIFPKSCVMDVSIEISIKLNSVPYPMRIPFTGSHTLNDRKKPCPLSGADFARRVIGYHLMRILLASRLTLHARKKPCPLSSLTYECVSMYAGLTNSSLALNLTSNVT